MIEIHYDYTDGTEVSYQEVLDTLRNSKKSSGIPRKTTTHCLDFFSTASSAIILKKSGEYMSTEEIMKNNREYTDKEIRHSHDLRRMLKTGALHWQQPKEQ